MVIREEEVMVVDHTVVVQEVLNGRSCQNLLYLYTYVSERTYQ